jgi:hypothetical protein
MLVALCVLLIGTAIGVIYYWVDFYIRGGVQVLKEEWYIRFQKAFLAADLWTSASAVTGAIGLLTEQTYGLVFTFLAASSLIFLGLMDITFNIQNNLYRLVATSGEMKFELFINFWTLGLGIALIVCLWSRVTLV